MRRKSAWLALAALLAVTALVAAGCGGSDDESAGGGTGDLAEVFEPETRL